MKYFIANWKANKSYNEMIDWSDVFLSQLSSSQQVINRLNNDQIKIIVCPPTPFIISLKEKFKSQKGLYLGSQDVSRFEQGLYTGETTALNLNGLVEYVIIGHSERRKNFMEKDEVLFEKSQMARKQGIKTIFCFDKNSQSFPKDADFLCYEPVAAISSGDGKGNNETIENIIEMKKNMILPPNTKFIYGGSVNEENISQYVNCRDIDGFLVGGASLDPLRFFKIISS